jgi:uncharacterized protein (TIGR03083 family)
VQETQTTREATVDTGNLYERTRREFIGTVLGLSDEQLQARVPATPAWSVREVLAHVVGLAADLNAQRFPAPDDDGTVWSNAQVERSKDSTLGDLIAEWDRESDAFEDGLRAFGYEVGSHFVADLYVHYQDVRSAVGLRPDADELTVAVALDHYLRYLSELLVTNDWGTLDIVAGDETRRLGCNGRYHAYLRTEPFELLRAVSGRRSGRQMRALDWSGHVDDVLALLQGGLTGGYALPESDLD